MPLFVGNPNTTKDFFFNTDSNGFSINDRSSGTSLTRMYVDANGNIGIGTTSPTSRLHIYGTTEATQRIEIDGTSNDTGIRLKYNGVLTGFVKTWQSGELNIGTASSAFLNFYTNNSERMRITSGGNVGIGTTSPANKLDIREDIYYPLSWGSTSNAYGWLSWTTGYAAIGTTTGNGLLLYTNGSERMRIDSSGKVGLGTISPSSQLHIASGSPTITVQDNNSAEPTSITKVDFGYNAGTLGFVGYDGLNYGALEVWNNYASGNVLIGTANTERVRITSAGNIGIGTTSPTHKLTIQGSGDITKITNGSASLFSYSDSQGMGWFTGAVATGVGAYYNNTNNYQTFYTASAERIRIDANGNIGIGTTGPLARLDVKAADGTGLYIGTSSVNYYDANFHVFRSTTQIERMRLDSSGNLGIGTTSANSKLHVSGGLYTSVRVESSLTQASLALYDAFTGSTDTRNWAITSNKHAYGDLAIATSFARGGDPITAGNTRFYINSAGNIGIGTTSPNVPLVVYRASGDAKASFVSGSNVCYLGWDDPNGLYFTSPTATMFQTNGSERMRIDSSGNIGIGTTSPTAYSGYTTLAINNATNGGVIDLLTNGTRHLTLYSGASTSTLGTVTSTNLGFISNNTERMRIAASGNVGIGTSSPAYNLQVNGSFAANTKSFVIDHPTKPNMKLRYGSLEGPENGVYVRGKCEGYFTIELPDYWTGLVDEDMITVSITPLRRYQKIFIKKIENNIVHLDTEDGTLPYCHFTIFGERKDVEKLVVEFDA